MIQFKVDILVFPMIMIDAYNIAQFHTDLKPKISFGNQAYFSLKFEKLSQFFQQK